jgi:digeranylgeranylglycerophospholipid reductase
VIEHRVNSAKLCSPRSEIVLKKKGTGAYVIDRSKFDKHLSGMTSSKILTECRVKSVSVKRDFVEVNTNKGRFESEMLVGCDGPNSIVAEGLYVKPREMIKGLIGIVKKKGCGSCVYLYFDKKRVKDGFFWKIPRGETTEYGVLGKDVKFTGLEGFFGLKNYERFAGLIPVSPVRKSYSRRILLVGSSAGQVKPWSGGGVIYGMTCAKIAANTVEKAFRLNDFSEGILKEYEKKWRREIGKQIKFGLLFRKFLRSSTNLQLDIAFRTGRLFDYGKLDMDFIL